MAAGGSGPAQPMEALAPAVSPPTVESKVDPTVLPSDALPSDALPSDELMSNPLEPLPSVAPLNLHAAGKPHNSQTTGSDLASGNAAATNQQHNGKQKNKKGGKPNGAPVNKADTEPSAPILANNNGLKQDVTVTPDEHKIAELAPIAPQAMEPMSPENSAQPSELPSAAIKTGRLSKKERRAQAEAQAQAKGKALEPVAQEQIPAATMPEQGHHDDSVPKLAHIAPVQHPHNPMHPPALTLPENQMMKPNEPSDANSPPSGDLPGSSASATEKLVPTGGDLIHNLLATAPPPKVREQAKLAAEAAAAFANQRAKKGGKQKPKEETTDTPDVMLGSMEMEPEASAPLSASPDLPVDGEVMPAPAPLSASNPSSIPFDGNKIKHLVTALMAAKLATRYTTFFDYYLQHDCPATAGHQPANVKLETEFLLNKDNAAKDNKVLLLTQFKKSCKVQTGKNLPKDENTKLKALLTILYKISTKVRVTKFLEHYLQSYSSCTIKDVKELKEWNTIEQLLTELASKKVLSKSGHRKNLLGLVTAALEQACPIGQ